MDNEAVSCPTYRLIGDPWPSLQHAVISGCALWLVLDPQSHEQALARLYEYEPDADISELFHRTHLQDLHDISPTRRGMKSWITCAACSWSKPTVKASSCASGTVRS